MEPFTTLIHRSGTIVFISRHQNISTQTCSALVTLFLAISLCLVPLLVLFFWPSVSVITHMSVSALFCFDAAFWVRFGAAFGAAFWAICLHLVLLLVPLFWPSVSIITCMSGSALCYALCQLTQSCWDKRINLRSGCHVTRRKTCKRQVFIVKIMVD